MSAAPKRSAPPSWLVDIPEAPVFRPTLEEFADPLAYIESISPTAQRAGICKVIPPPQWRPPFSVDFSSLTFPTRVQNIADLKRQRQSKKRAGRCGPKPALDSVICELCQGGGHEDVMLLCDTCGHGFHTFCLTPPLAKIPEHDWVCDECRRQGEDFGFVSGQEYGFKRFRRVASLFKERFYENRDASKVSHIEVEKDFWDIVELRAREVEVLYGNDLDTSVYGSGFPRRPCEGSVDAAFDYVRNPWNLNNFAKQPGSLLSELPNITGVTVPWLYVGMMFSSFCWHNEDHYMHSISYMHWGEAKTWYGVPGSCAKLFEDTVRASMPDVFDAHPDLLYQLVMMVSPRVLIQGGVPVVRAHQNPGEFIITFPASYHGGFSQGVNCGEAVNFATPSWLPMGREAINHYRLYHRNPVFSHEELVLACLSSPRLPPRALESVVREFDVLCSLEKDLRSRLATDQRDGMAVVRCETPVLDSLRCKLCTICKHQLFVSGITCECNPSRVACLSHVAQLCNCPPRKRCLHVRFTLSELTRMQSHAQADLAERKLGQSQVPLSPASRYDAADEPQRKRMKTEPGSPLPCMVAGSSPLVRASSPLVKATPLAKIGGGPRHATQLKFETPIAKDDVVAPPMGCEFEAIPRHHFSSTPPQRLKR